MIIFETSMGNISIEMCEKEVPITVKNFLQYVDDGHFDGLVFHRVIPGFMIQGGGMTADMKPRDTRDPIKNEADNGLKNKAYTLSMARTADINSATSQFFINVADNAFLDHGTRDFGYAVFAKVVDGKDVVDAIAAVPTKSVGYHDDVPVKPVTIVKARRAETPQA